MAVPVNRRIFVVSVGSVYRKVEVINLTFQFFFQFRCVLSCILGPPSMRAGGTRALILLLLFNVFSGLYLEGELPLPCWGVLPPPCTDGP